MFGIGLPELILILIVALLVVGPKKLPELARSVGKAIHDVKKMGEDVKDSLVGDIESQPSREEKESNELHGQTHTKDAKNETGHSDPDNTKPDPYNNMRG